MNRRPATKKEVRERSRQKLIRAIIKELRTTSPGNITTAAITKAAGLSQPSFYLHFEGVDAALRVTAGEITATLQNAVTQARAETEREASFASVRAAFAAAVHALLEHKALLEVYLMYRRDRASPFGRILSRFGETIRGQVIEDLRRLGAHEAAFGDVTLCADMINALTLTVVEALVDGRATDVDAAVDLLARAGWGLLRGVSRPQ